MAAKTIAFEQKNKKTKKKWATQASKLKNEINNKPVVQGRGRMVAQKQQKQETAI